MTIDKVLKSPIAEWPLLLGNVKDLQGAEQELSALIQRATLLEAYLSHRWNTGCGDQGHAASAKRANKTVVGVRRVLGFAYPKNTPLQVQP